MAENFNPRPREGSDGDSPQEMAREIHFNPRPREGSDLGYPYLILSSSISIHAPVKGATRSKSLYAAATPNFNPRPREGSDILARL